MSLHSIFTNKVIEAKEFCNDRNLKSSFYSAYHAGMKITFVPHKRDHGGNKPDLSYGKLIIEALVINNNEVNGGATAQSYRFEKDMYFADFARQLLSWAKCQNGLIAEVANSLEHIKQVRRPAFENFNMEPSVAIAWLLFIDAMFSGKYRNTQKITTLGNAKKGLPIKKRKTAKKEESEALYSSYAVTFKKDFALIKCKDKSSDFSVNVKPTEDEKVLNFEVLKGSEQICSFNASKKDLYTAVSHYLINRINSNTDVEIERAVTELASRYPAPESSVFADSLGQEIAFLPERLLYSMMLIKNHWKTVTERYCVVHA